MKVKVFPAGICLAAMISTAVAQVSTSTDQASDNPLTVITYTRPSFVAATAGAAALGIFGALSMIATGNKLVKKNSIDDPAPTMSLNLASLVAAKLKSSNTVFVRDEDDTSARRLMDVAGHKGVVLDVETIAWRFGYFPLDWTHYRVQYNARARLIDAVSGSIIGKSDCEYTSDDDQPSPTYDELLANQAALLKLKLSAAASTCTDTFSSQLLKPQESN